jgi:FkbM family methyltransferase
MITPFVFERKQAIEQPSQIEKELRLLFPRPEGLVIFDIGACEAEDSIKYSRLFPDSVIFSFEPLPQNVAGAKKNLNDYNVHNVRFVNKALSDKKGTAELFVSSGQPDDMPESDWDYGNKSSSLLSPDNVGIVAGFIKFNKKISVETTTLDVFCSENRIRKIDFIHMDVQGAELIVLTGASGSLNFIKAIWLEVSTVQLYKGQPLADDIEKFMHSNDFIMVKDCLYGICGDRLYISKQFFPNHRSLFPVWTRRKTFLRRVLRKAGF